MNLSKECPLYSSIVPSVSEFLVVAEKYANFDQCSSFIGNRLNELCLTGRNCACGYSDSSGCFDFFESGAVIEL